MKHYEKHKNHILILLGTLISSGYALGFAGYDSLKSTALIIATVIAVIPIAHKAIRALLMKVFSIELLVTIAVIGALFIQEYAESSIVTFLFLLGAYLEARTLQKTRESLKKLISMAPQEATVLRDGASITVSVEEVRIGELVVIRPGGKIPVDGKVAAGKATVNEAAITGEPAAAVKNPDDRVFAGTIVDSGYLEITAQKVGDDTTFAKIIELVEEAQEAKSKTQKFLDRFAGFYTPFVVLISIIVLAVTRNLQLAITFLVVACPGALVIGAPVSNVAGIGNGAKNGVLIKGGEVMERLSKIDTVVFDKTGTLTKGKPEVTDIKTFEAYDAMELLTLAAEAENVSEHPLGQTIVKEAVKRGIHPKRKPVDAEIIKGRGVIVRLDDYRVVIGNRELMEKEEIYLPGEALEYALQREKQGNTAIFASVEGHLKGIISIADQIREDAREALSEMRKKGIRKMIMLTGDNEHAAEQVATRLGLDGYHARLLPEDKVHFINDLRKKGHWVAMAGDGINDAPSIAAADIGLAMGESGTDVSIETADLVLMADRLSQFSHAYSLAKATVRNMKQNTYFAVMIVFVLLTGVLAGFIHLASGMFIHELSVLAVILNAIRLNGFGKQRKENKQQKLKLKEELL